MLKQFCRHRNLSCYLKRTFGKGMRRSRNQWREVLFTESRRGVQWMKGLVRNSAGKRNDVSRLVQCENQNSRSNSRSDPRNWWEPTWKISFAHAFSELFFFKSEKKKNQRNLTQRFIFLPPSPPSKFFVFECFLHYKEKTQPEHKEFRGLKAPENPKGPKIEKIQDRPPGLKFSIEIEIFKRATHQNPCFCGEFWRSGIENFKRDWKFQSRLKISIEIDFFQSLGPQGMVDSGMGFFGEIFVFRCLFRPWKLGWLPGVRLKSKTWDPVGQLQNRFRASVPK